MNRALPCIGAFCLVLILILVMTGCHRAPAGSYKICPQNGQLLGGRYTNDFFAFTIDVPTNWAVYNQTELDRGIHREYPKPERHYVPGMGWIEIPHTELYNLITMGDNAATLTDGTLTPTNATLTILAMRQPHFEDEGRPYDGRLPLAMLAGCMDIIQRSRERGSADMGQTGPAEVVLGGRKFYRDTLQVNVHGVPVIRRFYARIDNEHSLIFALLAPNDADLDRLEQVLATARFY